MLTANLFGVIRELVHGEIAYGLTYSLQDHVCPRNLSLLNQANLPATTRSEYGRYTDNTGNPYNVFFRCGSGGMELLYLLILGDRPSEPTDRYRDLDLEKLGLTPSEFYRRQADIIINRRDQVPVTSDADLIRRNGYELPLGNQSHVFHIEGLQYYSDQNGLDLNEYVLPSENHPFGVIPIRMRTRCNFRFSASVDEIYNWTNAIWNSYDNDRSTVPASNFTITGQYDCEGFGGSSLLDDTHVRVDNWQSLRDQRRTRLSSVVNTQRIRGDLTINIPTELVRFPRPSCAPMLPAESWSLRCVSGQSEDDRSLCF